MPVQVITSHGVPEKTITIVVTGDTSNAHIHQIFQRALNCWANAPADMKEVGDILTHGKILQDYRSQEFAEQKIRSEDLLNMKNGYTNAA